MIEVQQTDSPKRKSRWYQFSLRSLLIFTAVVAVTCGWLGSKIVRKRIEQTVVDALRKKGAQVLYDYNLARNGTPPGPVWVRRLLGENYFSEVQRLHLVGAQFGDDDLTVTKGLTQLEFL
jgi:hypothetical protein